jgi:TolA-binding protein
MVNTPLIMLATAYAAIASAPVSAGSPSEINSLERIISYVGILAMGWFFWKRESSKSDITIQAFKDKIKEVELEVRQLNSEINKLHEEIRQILKDNK